MESLWGKALLVGLGGFVGSAARFLLSSWVMRHSTTGSLPYGTLAVNGLGCLVIGLVAGAIEGRNALDPHTRRILLVGVLGGFTTFSTFALETLQLGQEGHGLRAVLNVALQVALGLSLAWLGYRVGSTS